MNPISKEAKLWRQRVEREILYPQNLTYAQYCVLEVVYDYAGEADMGVRMGTIARECVTTPGNITSIVDRLELKGLLRRGIGTYDRRVTVIYIPPDRQVWVGQIVQAVRGLSLQAVAEAK